MDGIGYVMKHAVAQFPQRTGDQPRMSRPGARPRPPVLRPSVLGVAALNLAVLVSAVTVAATRGGENDESRIRSLVQEFATSVAANPITAATLLCTPERETFEERINPDLVVVASTRQPEVLVSDVRVDGDVASATVAPPSGPSARMYFSKEESLWTVCAATGDPAEGGP